MAPSSPAPDFRFDAAAGFSKGVYRGIARLVKKPVVPTPKLELEDGSRIIDERQATERWMHFACAMTVNPLRPLRFWRPLRRPVLFSLLRYDRSRYAHRFLMWCIYSVVSNRACLREDLLLARPVSPCSAGEWTVISPAVCQGPSGS